LENTWKKRLKGKDWNNVTDKEILQKWVIPAYNEISEKLLQIFWKEQLNIFNSENIDSEKIDWLWFVWKPVKFNKKLNKDKINLIGFIWTDNLNILLNNNADDIVVKIAEECSYQINNILYLTSTGWLLDKEWNIIPFIGLDSLIEIIKWKHKEIFVEWWMLKKLETIKKQLEDWISKITVTNLKWLKDELETVEWSWTMFVNLEKAKFKKLDNYNLFKQIYNTQISNKNWKEKDEKNLKIISSDYNILELEWTILWWYYIWDFEIEINWKKESWKLLENLFSSKSGWWIWEILWKEILKNNNNIFAYSKKESFFIKLWFKKIEWQKSETWADLWFYEKS